jgi:hypothetical protein
MGRTFFRGPQPGSPAGVVIFIERLENKTGARFLRLHMSRLGYKLLQRQRRAMQ